MFTSSRLFPGEGKEPVYAHARIIAVEFHRDRMLSEYVRISSKCHTCSCRMERFLVCPPCYNEETEGLGLHRHLAMLRE